MNMNSTELLLQQLLGANDAQRSAAEQQVTEMQNQPEVYLSNLIGVLLILGVDQPIGSSFIFPFFCSKSSQHFNTPEIKYF